MRTLDYIKLDSAAAAKVVESLQQLLADYQVFYANLRGFHWNIKGHGFFVLHSKFEDLYNNAAEKVDELAERILMLGGVLKNKYSDYLKVSNIKEVEGVTNGDEALNNILETYSHFIVEERKLLAVASQAGDEATVAVMSDYLKEQEKMVWMLCAYASKVNRWFAFSLGERSIRVSVLLFLFLFVNLCFSSNYGFPSCFKYV